MRIKNNLVQLMAFLAIMGLLSGCAVPDEPNMALWNSEDCLKISKASGSFLHISGDLLNQSDIKRSQGDEKSAVKHAQEALFMTEIAANYAKNFEAYCKR